jgi:microcystin-dependent protein
MNSNRIFGLPDSPTADNNATSKKYVDTSIPVGGIIMWSGTTGTSLPSNWKLCDGSTYNSIKTPDLRGRFVLSSATQTSVGGIALAGGLTARTVDAIGGKETVALEETHMPAHTHDVSGSYTTKDGEGDHGHPVTVTTPGGVVLDKYYYPGGPSASHIATTINGTAQIQYTAINNPTAYPANGSGTHHKHTVKIPETSKGSGTAHENMPPFYVLAFIMRIS